MSDEGLISELEIFSVKRSDSALYTCQATNAYGKDEIRIQLKVKGLWLFFSKLVYLNILKGSFNSMVRLVFIQYMNSR